MRFKLKLKVKNDYNNLIIEAAKRYPLGTKYYTVAWEGNQELETVTGKPYWFISTSRKIGDAIATDESKGLIYLKGKWAEIVK